VNGRRDFLKSAYLFTFMAACNPDALFGPRKSRPLSMGAYVHCGWANPRPEYGLVPGVQCPNQYPWDVLRTRDREPELGYYDERDPGVTEWRCQQMERGGLGFAVYQVEWRHDTHELLMAHCAENHPVDSSVEFALSFFDVLDGSSDSYLPTFSVLEIETSQRAYARAVKRFTDRAAYLREDARPVLFFGYAHKTSPRFLQIVREEIPDVYLVATCCEPEAFPHLKARGFDAFTEYLLYADSWENVVRTYRDRWSIGTSVARETGIDYWVPACCGYDSSAWGSPVASVFLPTPAQFVEHLEEARSVADRNARNTKSRVVTYALNEFGEGGILEPLKPGMIRDRDEMLLAHASACGVHAV
jgi:hypothetical protein